MEIEKRDYLKRLNMSAAWARKVNLMDDREVIRRYNTAILNDRGVVKFK